MTGADEERTGDRHPAPPDVFASLASPTRREILTDLARRSTATASELAQELPVSRQAVVKHLTLLSEAGLVTSQRVGREVRYRVAPEPLTDIASWLATLGATWDRRLERLSRLLAAQPVSAEGDVPDPEPPTPDPGPTPERPGEAPERPDEIPTPQRPDEIPAPRRPDEIPTPQRPDEIPAPHRPDEFPTPQRPDEIPAPHRPDEIPAPERPFPSSVPEVPRPGRPPEVPPPPR